MILDDVPPQIPRMQDLVVRVVALLLSLMAGSYPCCSPPPVPYGRILSVL
jgi:hypothetical protein